MQVTSIITKMYLFTTKTGVSKDNPCLSMSDWKVNFKSGIIKGGLVCPSNPLALL